MKAKQYRRVSGFGFSQISANLSQISASKQQCLLLKISPHICGPRKCSWKSDLMVILVVKVNLIRSKTEPDWSSCSEGTIQLEARDIRTNEWWHLHLQHFDIQLKCNLFRISPNRYLNVYMLWLTSFCNIIFPIVSLVLLNTIVVKTIKKHLQVLMIMMRTLMMMITLMMMTTMMTVMVMTSWQHLDTMDTSMERVRTGNLQREVVASNHNHTICSP